MNIETYNSPLDCEKNLDFRPDLYRRHFDHLSRETSSDVAREVVGGMIQRDLMYMFWERFTKEKLVHFSYRFDGDGVVSPKYEALGDVIASYEAAIELRRSEGKPSDREEAELGGFTSIIRETKGLPAENTPGVDKGASWLTPGVRAESSQPKAFTWISRPEDCGSYSFYFFGKYDPEERQIDMYAWRNEKDLQQQRLEANAILGGDYFSVEVHQYDFLRNPIIIDGQEFNRFRQVIADMPTEAEFWEAKQKDFSIYRDGVARHAQMLSALIANGADDETLLLAQAEIEMDCTKWIVDGRVELPSIDTSLFSKDQHHEFSRKVYESLGGFVVQYGSQAKQFACGTCGVSVLSQLNLSSISTLARLAPDLFGGGGTKPCGNCGATLEASAQTCDSCHMSKADYDLKKAPQR